MNNIELQKRYNSLKDKLDISKMAVARAQGNLETAEKQMGTALSELLSLTKTTTLEEAKQVYDKLHAKLEEMVGEAEALLNDAEGK